ncbi:hypothetical protein FB451DRAFT_1191875 [Mycena latifolia]|nr:hypothetical protein FB451DRAFT_1191875 [Mycena latifolia]
MHVGGVHRDQAAGAADGTIFRSLKQSLVYTRPSLVIVTQGQGLRTQNIGDCGIREQFVIGLRDERTFAHAAALWRFLSFDQDHNMPTHDASTALDHHDVIYARRPNDDGSALATSRSKITRTMQRRKSWRRVSKFARTISLEGCTSAQGSDAVAKRKLLDPRLCRCPVQRNNIGGVHHPMSPKCSDRCFQSPASTQAQDEENFSD